MTQKTNQNPWTMDVRVRERNLKSGALTDKELEKYLATLPDLADHVEPFGTHQPALAQQVAAVAEVSAAQNIAEASQEQEEEEEEEEAEGASVEGLHPQEPIADPVGITNGEGQQP